MCYPNTSKTKKRYNNIQYNVNTQNKIYKLHRQYNVFLIADMLQGPRRYSDHYGYMRK